MNFIKKILFQRETRIELKLWMVYKKYVCKISYRKKQYVKKYFVYSTKIIIFYYDYFITFFRTRTTTGFMRKSFRI